MEIQPISREETDLRQQSTTIIAPNIQEVEGNDQSNHEEVNFLFHGQGASCTRQTNSQ